jgi:hypothetical protein
MEPSAIHYEPVEASASPEVPMNQFMDNLEFGTVYAHEHQTSNGGTTWGYWGGRWSGFAVSEGTLTLTNTADNYIVVLRADGVISTSTATTNWLNTAAYARVYKVTLAGGVVTAVEDHRAGAYGIHGSIDAASVTYLAPRVTSTASSTTPTPDADTTDIYILTALAAGATFGAPTGTPVQGQALVIRIKDNGTARALAFNAIYRAIGATLPTTTVISKTMYLGLIYNSTDTKWDVVAVREEA